MHSLANHPDVFSATKMPMTSAADIFFHCPKCSKARSSPVAINPFRCSACEFVFYFNPTVAAAGFLTDRRGRTLVIRRAKDPGKGKYAVPGGFIDIGESAEIALRREVLEEVGVDIQEIQYLGSFVNYYPFQGITYPVLDLIYTARVVNPEAARPLDAVAGIEWCDLQKIPDEEWAFPSLSESAKRLIKV